MLSLCQCELLCLVMTAIYEICIAVFVMVLLSGMLRHVDWQIVTDLTEKLPVFAQTLNSPGRHSMVLKNTRIFIFRDI